MSKTKISWCDEVWNPVVGCTEACSYCYARELHDKRNLAWRKGWDTAPVQYRHSFDKIQLLPMRLDIPLKRKKPTVFFVNSVSDLFDPAVPDSFIDRVYAVMALRPEHTFLVLTKQASRMAEYWADSGLSARIVALASQPIADHPHDSLGTVGAWRRLESWPLPNVWHGVTAENQQTADERIPPLFLVPGKRFLSLEPLLGPIGMYWYGWKVSAHHRYGIETPRDSEIHAVILGGESGKNARPMHPDWVRSVRDQCAEAEIPFTLKQWGVWSPDCLCGRAKACKTIDRPEGRRGVMFRCGKKAGRTLDGVIHNNLPWDQQGESK